MINLRGRIKLLAAQHGAWHLLARAAAVTEGTGDSDDLTAALAAAAASLPGFEIIGDRQPAGSRELARAQAEQARRERAGRIPANPATGAAPTHQPMLG